MDQEAEGERERGERVAEREIVDSHATSLQRTACDRSNSNRGAPDLGPQEPRAGLMRTLHCRPPCDGWVVTKQYVVVATRAFFLFVLCLLRYVFSYPTF